MKKALLALLVLGMAGYNVQAQQMRGLVVEEEDGESNEELLDQFYDDSWLLVIGIDEYPGDGLTDLENAVNDARGVRDVMQDYFGFPEENTIELYNEEATRNNIVGAFDELANNTGRNDRVMVFYAGHGTQTELGDGRERGYIIPYDGDIDRRLATTISTEDLASFGEMIRAKHMYYVMDACYGGMIHSTRATSISPQAQNYMEAINQRHSRQAITAGGADEPVLDDYRGGHSVFTYNFISGLRDGLADLHGNGIITANELRQFMIDRVTTASQGRQNPQAGALPGDDMGDFIFVRTDAVYEEEGAEDTQTMASVEIETEPEGAEVYVEGELMGTTPVFDHLSFGRHEVTIKKEGYDEDRRVIEVGDHEDNTFHFDLESHTVPIRLSSNVEDARVYIDDQQVGTLSDSEFDWDLRPGRYRVRVEKDRYSPEVQEIQVEPEEEEELEFELESLYAAVTIETSPEDARIILDDRVMGEGLVEDEIQKGAYNVRVERTGFETREQQIEVLEDDHWYFPLSESFIPLTVHSEVEGAEVYIDGDQAGKIENQEFRTELPLGNYEVEVEKPRYATAAEEVDISTEDPRTVELNPEYNYTRLQVQTDPDDAEIWVDGRLIGIGEAEEEIRKGERVIQVSKSGYLESEEQVLLNQDELQRDYSLAPIMKEVELTSEPSGATVYIDGEPAGETPFRTDLNYGDREIRVAKDNYEEEYFNIAVDEPGSVNRFLNLNKTAEYEAELIYDDRRSSYNSRATLSLLGAAAGAGAAYFFHTEMLDSYDHYQTLGTGQTSGEFDEAWEEYEQNRDFRNYIGGTSGLLTLLGIFNIIRSPDYDSILEDVQDERVSVNVTGNGSYAGVTMKINF